MSEIIEISSSSEEESVVELSSESECEAAELVANNENQLVFLDLSHQQIIQDEGHSRPYATEEQLEQIGKRYEDSLVNDEQSMAEKFANVTIRKRVRFRKMSTYPPFRKSLADQLDAAIALSELERSKAPPSNNEIKGFLESLDENIAVGYCHPEALKFKQNLTSKMRMELVEKLKTLYNKEVFDNKLTSVPCSWNKWMGLDAGFCEHKIRNGIHEAHVVLNQLILIKASQVRNILIHEMCHAAVWIIDGKDDDNNGHGKLWNSWMDLALERLPSLSKIERHSYEMPQKFTYKCSVCSASSLANSKPRNGNTFCGYCHGPIEVFRNRIHKNGNRTLAPLRKPFGFALFVKQNYKQTKQPGDSHVTVMQTLSHNFSSLTVNQKKEYRKSFFANAPMLPNE